MKLGGVRRSDAAQEQGDGTPPSQLDERAPSDVRREAASVTESSPIGEKERLQEQVNIFSRQAMKGSPCTLVRRGLDGTCTCQECLYKIDKSFTVLSVLSKTSGSEMVAIRITHIQ